MLRNGQKSHIKIPEELWRDKLGWKISQDVNIREDNGKIIIEEIKPLKVKSLDEFMEMDFSKEGHAAERGYRRGYRHGYNNGIDDMYATGAYRKLCKFFDEYIMPWTAFKNKDKGFSPPPEFATKESK